MVYSTHTHRQTLSQLISHSHCLSLFAGKQKQHVSRSQRRTSRSLSPTTTTHRDGRIWHFIVVAVLVIIVVIVSS